VEAYRVVRHVRLPHFLGSLLTDGDEVVSLMCRSPFFNSRADNLTAICEPIL
jgi:hypothetical protein